MLSVQFEKENGGTASTRNSFWALGWMGSGEDLGIAVRVYWFMDVYLILIVQLRLRAHITTSLP